MPFPDSEYPSILRGRDKRESQRLMATAPEMLAALRSIQEELDSWVWVNVAGHRLPFSVSSDYADRLLTIVHSAIAKAEGRSE